MTLNDDITLYLKTERAVTFQDLLQHLRSRDSSINAEQVTDAVWGLARTGVLTLEDILPATTAVSQYLKFWERNLDLYFIVGVSIVALFVILAPFSFLLIVLRWAFGTVFVLFIPGFALTETLFPKGTEIDMNQRFAISVGLSLALVPLVGLALNYSPWGIRLNPIVASLVTLSIGMSLVCFVRRYRFFIHSAPQ
jgi:uncharacterized membrane protein